MGARPGKFTEAELRRAIKVAKREDIDRIVILPDGTIRFTLTEVEKPVPVAMEFITQQHIDERRLPKDRVPRIYFVRLGRDRAVKIGFTTSLDSRLKAYRTGSSSIHLLVAFEGDRSVEKLIHRTLSEHRVERELFDWQVVDHFISILRYGGLGAALKYYEKPEPDAQWKSRRAYLAEYKKQKQDFDQRCADAVGQRRTAKGW